MGNEKPSRGEVWDVDLNPVLTSPTELAVPGGRFSGSRRLKRSETV